MLIAAHRRDADGHLAAARAVGDLAASGSPWAIPWPCVHEFLAIATHARIFSPPSTLTEALDQIDAWRESPTVAFLSEGPGYWTSLTSSLQSANVSGARIHDARVAVLCTHYGVTELWTADRDFTRFPAIRVVNPLVR